MEVEEREKGRGEIERKKRFKRMSMTKELLQSEGREK